MSLTATKLNVREKPRVLVIGLLDRQVFPLHREFPELHLDFVEGGRGWGVNRSVDQRIRAADRIVLIPWLLPHSLTKKVTDLRRGNVVTLPGKSGLSSVRDTLRGMVAAMEFDYRMVPVLPMAAALELVPPSQQIDFGALLHAHGGQLLTYIRPERMPAHAFETELQNAVRDAKRHGVTATYEIRGGKATLTIERAKVLRLPIIEDRPRIPPQFAHVLANLWRVVYIAAIKRMPYMPPATHAAAANAAVRGWLFLFNPRSH